MQNYKITLAGLANYGGSWPAMDELRGAVKVGGLRSTVRLSRASAVAWGFVVYWIAMGGMAISSILTTRVNDLLALPILAVLAGLIARTAMIGFYLDKEGGLKVVDWLRAREFPPGGVTSLRAVPYSGFGNRGGTSRLLKMLEIEGASKGKILIRSAIGPRESVDRLEARIVRSTSRPAS